MRRGDLGRYLLEGMGLWQVWHVDEELGSREEDEDEDNDLEP